MLIVADDRAAVDADLEAGRLSCPSCGVGVLGGWGCARLRRVRTPAGWRWLRPRRGRCREMACRATHVLLPEICLTRRHDVVEVIGAALTASATGSDHRQIAAELGLPAGTVRGWVRRARERAQDIRAHFTGWAAALDQAAVAELRPAGGELADAVEAIAAAGRAAVVELGVGRSPWSLASVLTAGALLSNTTSPWMAVP